jgi:hypothetical protein
VLSRKKVLVNQLLHQIYVLKPDINIRIVAKAWSFDAQMVRLMTIENIEGCNA